MLNNMSIKNKSIVITLMMGLSIVLLISALFYGVNSLNKSSYKMSENSEIGLHNQKILTAHESYAGNLARAYMNQEDFKGGDLIIKHVSLESGIIHLVKLLNLKNYLKPHKKN